MVMITLLHPEIAWILLFSEKKLAKYERFIFNLFIRQILFATVKNVS
jgi:hypothetical protein